MEALCGLRRSLADYIHRVGRTGRAGAKGEAVTLFTEADIPNLRSIALAISEAGLHCVRLGLAWPSYFDVWSEVRKSNWMVRTSIEKVVLAGFCLLLLASW